VAASVLDSRTQSKARWYLTCSGCILVSERDALRRQLCSLTRYTREAFCRKNVERLCVGLGENGRNVGVDLTGTVLGCGQSAEAMEFISMRVNTEIALGANGS
jgi:hypothetical protein